MYRHKNKLKREEEKEKEREEVRERHKKSRTETDTPSSLSEPRIVELNTYHISIQKHENTSKWEDEEERRELERREKWERERRERELERREKCERERRERLRREKREERESHQDATYLSSPDLPPSYSSAVNDSQHHTVDVSPPPYNSN